MGEIRLNAFEVNGVGFGAQGLWAHPDDRACDYTNIDHWISYAKMLERGKFDGIFFADLLGVPDTYQDSARAALQAAAYVPVNDPLLLIPVLAAATTDLSFGVTSNVMFEQPYFLARRFSTLDHLTQGRIGWNIVTSMTDPAKKAVGITDALEHDARYDLADEFMEIVYELWEKSWADDAVIRDRERRVYVSPERVRKITHSGKYFNVEAIHHCEPSPQRTPVLYQSGASGRGQRFAAQHAECVFLNGLTTSIVKDKIRGIRDAAAACGRAASEILFFQNALVVVDETEALARKKLRDAEAYVDVEAGYAIESHAMGVNLSTTSKKSIGSASPENLSTAQNWKDVGWTAEDRAKYIGGRSCLIIGNPEQVCDQLQHWVEETGLDGFNLGRILKPGTMRDFVDMVVPELQKRGVYKREYRPGTYREKLFGSSLLTAAHPGCEARCT